METFTPKFAMELLKKLDVGLAASVSLVLLSEAESPVLPRSPSQPMKPRLVSTGPLGGVTNPDTGMSTVGLAELRS